MVQTNSSTTIQHYGHWASRAATLTCEACGNTIPAGQLFLWFPWFPSRRHTTACVLCGTTAAAEVAA